MNSKKQITEEQILAELAQGDWELGPLTLEEVQIPSGERDRALDAIVTLGWRGRTFRFGTEIRRLWTPKEVLGGADEASRNAGVHNLSPLVVVPYLSDVRLRELESRGVSGIDLCGNAVLVVPGELLVYRSGSPNRFRWEGRIKNVYRGTSAIVARVFLLTPEFPSLADALDEIRVRGAEVTLPTVSKVCKSLDQDLVIERTRGRTPRSRKLRLLQPEKLLDLLRENYAPPEVTRTLLGKFTGSQDALIERLHAWEREGARKVVLTGTSSVDTYAVMARESMQTFYCPDAVELKKELGESFTESERFPTVRLLETKDEFVYFDRRPGLMASPVQTYLELATGEKREKDTAEQVRRFILGQLSATERKE